MAKRYADQEIISMILSSDIRVQTAAITYLYNTCEESIIRLVVTNSGTREDGEEILTDTILTFFNKVRESSFTLQSAQVTTFLYRIAKFRWLNELRKNNPHAGVHTTLISEEWESEQAYSPSSEYENHDLVQRLLEKLEPGCQKLIRAFMEGWSMEDIAAMVGLKNAATAKAQKYHCLKKLGKSSNLQL